LESDNAYITNCPHLEIHTIVKVKVLFTEYNGE
jgi:hypothetical protein